MFAKGTTCLCLCLTSPAAQGEWQDANFDAVNIPPKEPIPSIGFRWTPQVSELQPWSWVLWLFTAELASWEKAANLKPGDGYCCASEPATPLVAGEDFKPVEWGGKREIERAVCSCLTLVSPVLFATARVINIGCMTSSKAISWKSARSSPKTHPFLHPGIKICELSTSLSVTFCIQT